MSKTFHRKSAGKLDLTLLVQVGKQGIPGRLVIVSWQTGASARKILQYMCRLYMWNMHKKPQKAAWALRKRATSSDNTKKKAHTAARTTRYPIEAFISLSPPWTFYFLCVCVCVVFFCSSSSHIICNSDECQWSSERYLWRFFWYLLVHHNTHCVCVGLHLFL